jgi:hypothetical protein
MYMTITISILVALVGYVLPFWTKSEKTRFQDQFAIGCINISKSRPPNIKSSKIFNFTP